VDAPTRRRFAASTRHHGSLRNVPGSLAYAGKQASDAIVRSDASPTPEAETRRAKRNVEPLVLDVDAQLARAYDEALAKRDWAAADELEARIDKRKARQAKDAVPAPARHLHVVPNDE
jgi:hypothetical protein